MLPAAMEQSIVATTIIGKLRDRSAPKPCSSPRSRFLVGSIGCGLAGGAMVSSCFTG